jgi:hypothetical protein
MGGAWPAWCAAGLKSRLEVLRTAKSTSVDWAMPLRGMLVPSALQFGSGIGADAALSLIAAYVRWLPVADLASTGANARTGPLRRQS